MLLKADPHSSCQPRGSEGLPDTGCVSGSTAFTPDPDGAKCLISKADFRAPDHPHPRMKPVPGEKALRLSSGCRKPLKADTRQAGPCYPLAWEPRPAWGQEGAHTRAQTQDECGPR